MKNRLVVIVWSLLITGGAFAQSLENLDYGVTVGVGATSQTQSGINSDDLKNIPGPGFRLGGFARYHFTGDWSVQSGLEFAMLHAGQKFSTGKSKLTLTSVVLPIQAVYTLPVGDRRWMVSAGPAFRFNLSGKYKDDYGSANLKFGKDKENRFFVPGLQMGVRYKTNLNVNRLFSRKTALMASLNPRQNEEMGGWIITGIDGTVQEWDYVSKQYKPKHKEGWWEIMFRIFINFATNRRDNRGSKA